MKKILIITLILIITAAFGFSQTFEKQGSGVTILVHGWNPDGDQPAWMSSMANTIIARSGGDGQIATITVTGSVGNLTATCTDWDFSMTTATSGQIVVLVNWTAVANHLTTYVTAQEVAAAVTPKIYEPQNGQAALAELPIHLIGHSRGGGMVFEIARLLGLEGVEVEHLTALDPHPLTEADPQPLMGTHTIDTPVALYENVLFADNYYQNIEFPTGQYVTGAYNRLWESLPGGYHNETGYTYTIGTTTYNFSNHLNIILAYHGTVDLATPATNGEATMTQIERDAWFNSYEVAGENIGFKYSRQIMGNRKSNDIPNSGDAVVDGFHNNALLGGNGVRESLDWSNAVWTNVLETTISLNSSTLSAGVHNIETGDALDIDFIYRSYANAGTVTLYADLDRNPYNTNLTAIGTINISATGSTITANSLNWTVAGLTVGETYYIFTKIDDGTNTRYLYSPYEFKLTPVATEPAAGNGSEANPYEIHSLENLYWLSQNSTFWDTYFIQTADIDAAETVTWFGGQGFPPIGIETTPFVGTYNGDNYTISNLYINRDADYIGLFGYLGTYSNNASLKNIILENVDINCSSGNAWYAAGTLAGYFEYGTVDNCHSSGTINADDGVGGLIGSNQGLLTNSSSSCNVTGIELVGGFVGDHGMNQILNCSASGNVAGTSYVGGFSSYFLGSEVSNCFAKGDVSGNEFVGGFAGEMRHSAYNTIVSNCYSWGNVTRLSGSASDYIGGFIASCDDNGQSPTTVEYSYSIGSVTYQNATNPTDKGFIGMQTGTHTYTANFFNSSTSGQSSGIGASQQITSGMQTGSTFTDVGWDFMAETANGTDDDWGINSTDNNAYPFLKWQGYKLVPEITQWPIATDLECGLTLADVVLTGGNADAAGNFVFRNADIIPPYGTNDFEIVFAPDDFESYDSISNTISVAVIDTGNPILDISTLDDINAECEVTSLTAPTATDNCAGVITGTHDAALPITTQGTTTVTWTYADGNGNTITQTQDVVIEDVTNPVPDVATLSDVSTECEITSLTAPTASDNCAGAITGTHDATLPITAQGTTTVTWTYDDGNGNTITQTQDVVIEDVTNPVPDVATLSDVTAQCEVTTLTAPTATDNCSGAVTGTHDATLPITAQGTTTVTWTYADGNGNSITQTQDVVIEDVTNPVPDVAALSDVTAECEVTSLTAPTASDNCSGELTGTHSLDLPITASTTITWTYEDGAGNTSTQTQEVIIADQTAPVADLVELDDITAQCEVTTLTAPTATDNCAGAITGTHGLDLPITASTTITWTYEDGAGNTTTQTQEVIIADQTAPVADLVELDDITAQCEVTTLTAPTATDNCAGAITGTHDATLPITTQGTTTVTWTYADGNGNTITQTQDVVIEDVTNPVPDVATLSDVTAQCEVTSLTAPTATDNCAGAITGTHDATLPITAQGTTAVTWTYADGNGNTITQTQDVVIEDVTNPVPDVAALSAVTAECEVTSLTAPTATDNCAGTVTGTHDATLPITTQGTTTVTWTYTDGNGNTITQTQDVVIEDVTNPAPDVATLSDVTAECEVTSLTAPTATDNCAGAVTGTHDATLPITAQGTTTVTWTYADGNGNTITQTQDVVIEDVTNPVPDVATLSDVTAVCEVTTLTAPTATDNCAGAITGTHDATLPITAQGTTTVIWTYADGNGNTNTQTQDVVIEDVTNPVPDVATLSDVTAECEVTSLTAPTATDNCAGAITGTHDATLPITAQGTTTVTWTYADGNGNTITQTQDVVIEDVTNPVPDVAALSDVTAECEVTSLTAPTASDNCSGELTGTHSLDLPITASTTITWTYEDGAGNTSTQTQEVIIADQTAPVADLVELDDITAQCEVTTLTAPTATDNCAGAITGTHGLDLPITASTTITWTYEDGAGNTTTQTQEVIIADQTAPVADLVELDDITAQCDVTSLTAPTATDNCAGNITGTHDSTLPITTQGTTTVTWTYADGNGNSITQTQDVVIEDVTNPASDVATLSDVTAECEVTTLTAPTATDNCAGAITGTHDATLPITAQGTTTVTWTYADGNGNTITQTQDVVIEDVTNPVPDVATLSDVTAQCEVTSLTAPTATDNCAGAITGTHSLDLPITASTTITWTYADGNGNTITQTQDVVIEDVTNPVPDVATLSDVTAQCEVTSLTAPTATDNCAGAITGTHSLDLPITASTTITWTYADGNGNTITQTQDVVIEDVTNPVPDVATLSNVTAQCEVTSLTAPTATDNCSGAVTGTHDATLPITTQGTTTVTWTYDDGNGNSITQTQDVVIEDVTNPVPDVATLSDVSTECEITSLTAPTATDNCAGAITGTHNATLPITAQGTTTVTWNYTDGNGNTITQTQDVVIEDLTNPTLTCTQEQEVDADETHIYTVQGSEFDPTGYDDNCEVESIENDFNSTETLAGAELPEGTTTIVWTVTDIAGNSDYCELDVVVNEYVGIGNFDVNTIGIYPNPFSNDLVIDAKGYSGEIRFEIYNSMGHIIYQDDIIDKSTVNTSSFSPGVYLIKLENGNAFELRKIIKQ